MRVIFERVDKQDYIEVILTEKEVEKISEKVVAKDFATSLYGKNSLNICVRQENIYEQMEVQDATKESQEQSNNKQKRKGIGKAWTPAEACSRRGFNNGSQIRGSDS